MRRCLLYALLLLVVVGGGVLIDLSIFSDAAEPSPSCYHIKKCELCSLYRAPSSIPNAGYGIYTSKDLIRGETVGDFELIIPIKDVYKTYPYRGQERFKSWLGYVWPEYVDVFYPSDTTAFPRIPIGIFPDDGLSAATGLEFFDFDDDDEETTTTTTTTKQISAFVPGLASLVNSNRERVNLSQINHHNDDGTTTVVSFQALHDIKAGSELFLDYGDEWYETLYERQTSKTEYDTINDYNKDWDFTYLPTEVDKRNKMELTTRRKTSRKLPYTGAFKKSEDEYDEEEDEDEDEFEHIRPLDWLETNGFCVDIISRSAAHTQGGSFAASAKRPITAGQVISTSPLLALKRDDLVIYERKNENNANQKNFRDVLNFEKIIGMEEQLLNLSYSHPNSQLLLIPLSPGVNWIKHGKNPNVEIRWPSSQAASEWLNLHPIDVAEMSGKIYMEFVALRDIKEGEEIVINKGEIWDNYMDSMINAREDDEEQQEEELIHEIEVPNGFFPDKWLDTNMSYEVDTNKKLKPGELQPLVWKHNGKPISKHAYRIGLPTGFSEHMLRYAEKMGIVDKYKKIIEEDSLVSDDWFVFDSNVNVPKEEEEGGGGGEWFAQRYKSDAWSFNMHYIAPWNEVARKSLLREMGSAGFFDMALETIGNAYGLDNMTCFHVSFMGVSYCDESFTHTDVYATGEKGFNLVWPIILVDGSKPELDVQSDDGNVVISINYEYDTAVVMGDWGYHKTSSTADDDTGAGAGGLRIVVGSYCAQVDDTTSKMLAYIYDGEDPAPFMWQFHHPELHWSRDGAYKMPQYRN